MKIEWKSIGRSWFGGPLIYEKGHVDGKHKYNLVEAPALLLGDKPDPKALPGTFSLELILFPWPEPERTEYHTLGNGKTLEEMKELAERNEQ